MYFGCEGCDFKSFDKDKTEKHIKECYMLPKNKTCQMCENLDGFFCTKGRKAQIEVTEIKCTDFVLNEKIPKAVFIRN